MFPKQLMTTIVMSLALALLLFHFFTVPPATILPDRRVVSALQPLSTRPDSSMPPVSVDWVVGEDNLPGTLEAQRLLHASQHPPDCSDRLFYVVGLRDCGLGGVLHALSYALARAMHRNRTLLVVPPAKWHFLPNNVTHTGLDYYFEPLSSCPLPAPTTSHLPGQYQHLRVSEGSSKYGLVPHQFKQPLVWWRAQSVRYILRRPLPWYERHLQQFTSRVLPDGLPPHTIAMHVRRSDKHTEAKDTPFEKYMAAAQQMRQQDPRLTHIFLSTEDDSVINATIHYPHWKFHYCAEDRHNWNHYTVARMKDGQHLADISFANLYLHLKCDHLIITRKSNWCRLIEEMRLTGNCSSCRVWNLSPVYGKSWY
eukprot:NODE_2258_length_1233_cov_20.420434_g2147_i0.p1 GENE.NODE_2258_length_1233_cov_20.420434_g2147_i0~~NODE_2258_length_1233_cov_20.420434_g2147_i0.p1  ORF type:complete len:367 (-),score=54.74 NODE_2258_length_1233_cov_20.420434_g2147_i0:86-1186(-)